MAKASKSKTGDIRLIQLANYIKPDIKETPGRRWVLNGPKNAFFKYVIDRYNGSTTNSAIINSYADLMYGKGLADVATEKEIDDATLLIIPKKENKKILADYALFSRAVLQIGKEGKAFTISHMASETIVPAKVDSDGEIKSYFYCQDWENPYKYKPIEYPAFGYREEFDKRTTNQGLNEDDIEDIEIYVVQPYKAGKFYFSDPEYFSGLQYAEMEEEMSNYSLSFIKGGLSFGYIVNFNNGNTLSNEEKDELEKKITEKLTGSSNAGRFIISFNNGKEAEVTVVPFEQSEAHSQWEWLSKESEQKILRAHRVTNPILVGIKENTGLGNNADEMDVAESQLMKRVIAPKQEMIIDAYEDIFEANGKKQKFYFLPLSEVDEDGDNVDEDGNKKTDESNKIDDSKDDKKDDKNKDVKLKKHTCTTYPIQLSKRLIELGEDMDGWELISEAPVNYETCDIEDEAYLELGVIKDDANKKSEQDAGLFKVRYKYMPLRFTKDDDGNVVSRTFCKEMVTANKVYRKEDIQSANSLIENEGWGEFGTERYSLWLYKGGGDCHHYWQRQIYFRMRNADGSFKPNKGLSNDKVVSVNKAKKAGFTPIVNESEVAKLPTDMKKRGFLHRFQKAFQTALAGFDPNQKRNKSGKWASINPDGTFDRIDEEKKGSMADDHFDDTEDILDPFTERPANFEKEYDDFYILDTEVLRSSTEGPYATTGTSLKSVTLQMKLKNLTQNEIEVLLESLTKTSPSAPVEKKLLRYRIIGDIVEAEIRTTVWYN